MKRVEAGIDAIETENVQGPTFNAQRPSQKSSGERETGDRAIIFAAKTVTNEGMVLTPDIARKRLLKARPARTRSQKSK